MAEIQAPSGMTPTRTSQQFLSSAMEPAKGSVASQNITSSSTSHRKQKFVRSGSRSWFNKSFDQTMLSQTSKPKPEKPMRRQNSVTDFFQSMLTKSKYQFQDLFSSKKDKSSTRKHTEGGPNLKNSETCGAISVRDHSPRGAKRGSVDIPNETQSRNMNIMTKGKAIYGSASDFQDETTERRKSSSREACSAEIKYASLCFDSVPSDTESPGQIASFSEKGQISPSPPISVSPKTPPTNLDMFLISGRRDYEKNYSGLINGLPQSPPSTSPHRQQQEDNLHEQRKQHQHQRDKHHCDHKPLARQHVPGSSSSSSPKKLVNHVPLSSSATSLPRMGTESLIPKAAFTDSSLSSSTNGKQKKVVQSTSLNHMQHRGPRTVVTLSSFDSADSADEDCGFSKSENDEGVNGRMSVASAPAGRLSTCWHHASAAIVGSSGGKRLLIKSNSDSFARLDNPASSVLSTSTPQLMSASSDCSSMGKRKHKKSLATGIKSMASVIVGITDYLFLGSVEAAYSEPILCKYGISSLIDMTNTCPSLIPAHKKSDCPCACVANTAPHFRSKLNIGVDDIEWENLEQYFDEINAFINGAKRKGRRVLIFSYMGQSRAAAAVIQHLMTHFQMPYQDALSAVRIKRPQIKLNSGFVKALKRLERKLGLDNPGLTTSGQTRGLKGNNVDQHHFHPQQIGNAEQNDNVNVRSGFMDTQSPGFVEKFPQNRDSAPESPPPPTVKGAWLEC